MKRLEITGLDPDDLKALISETVQSELTNLKASMNSQSYDEILTRKDVAALLKINLSTISEWCKSGKLQPYGIGNRVYFKRSEIEQSLKPLSA